VEISMRKALNLLLVLISSSSKHEKLLFTRFWKQRSNLNQSFRVQLEKKKMEVYTDLSSIINCYFHPGHNRGSSNNLHKMGADGGEQGGPRYGSSPMLLGLLILALY
jgi:hypothetical protein